MLVIRQAALDTCFRSHPNRFMGDRSLQKTSG